MLSSLSSKLAASTGLRALSALQVTPHTTYFTQGFSSGPSTPSPGSKSDEQEKNRHLKTEGGLVPPTWVDRQSHTPWGPYLALSRLDRPIGSWLLWIPGGISAVVATPPGGMTAMATYLAASYAGAVLCRGAGCTINDLIDRNLDAQVERTASRPIASGQVSVAGGVAWAGAQLAAASYIALNHIPTASAAAVLPFLPLLAIYPTAKRWTNYPQAVLGITFNAAVFTGALAVVPPALTGMSSTPTAGSWLKALAAQPTLSDSITFFSSSVSNVLSAVDWTVAGPLYGAMVLWTVYYDTIYAHMDKADDVKVGIKSTALTWGNERTRTVLKGLALSSTGLLAAVGSTAGLGWPWLVGIAGGNFALWQHANEVKLNDRADCMAKFKASRNIGLSLLFVAWMSNPSTAPAIVAATL